ncbi:MAG: FHA domain-containing protein, partial [Candidatus Binataceae bacterium]
MLAIDHRAPNSRLSILARGDSTIGSAAGSAVKIADGDSAPVHALITYKHGHYYVADLKSAGGTFLNDRRIRRRRALTHNDRLRFGETAGYRFLDPDAGIRRQYWRAARISLIAILAVAGWLAHREQWDGGVLSAASFERVAVLAQSHAESGAGDPSVPSATVSATTGHPNQMLSPVSPVRALEAKREAATSAMPRAIAAVRPASQVATSSPVASPQSAARLERINQYRKSAGIELLHEDSAIR